MQACCLSDFEVVVHCLCEFSLVPDLLILFSHSLCLHPLTSLSTLYLCQLCLCRPCLLVLFVLTLLACITSTSLCLSSVSLPTLLVRTLCVYVNSLCLCPLCLSAPSVTLCPLYVFVSTLISLSPRCVFAHPLVVFLLTRVSILLVLFVSTLFGVCAHSASARTAVASGFLSILF